MPLESQNSKNEGDIISLTSAYIKAVYAAKGDTNHQTAIKIKNQIVVLLGVLYKDILDSYIKDSLDKAKVTSFVQIVSHFIASGIIKAREDMYGFLIEKNITLAHTDKQIEIVKAYINTEIDKNISNARSEMDSVIDIFRQRCLEILLDGQKHTSNMLEMSHKRSMERLGRLSTEKKGLETKIIGLEEEKNGLNETITTLQADLQKKQTIITKGYHSWMGLNSRVQTLEKEKDEVLNALGAIEKELAKKRRKLKGTTLIEKINGMCHFTAEMQAQETRWQETFIKLENKDRVEAELNSEIFTLRNRLGNAQVLLQEVNNELFEEQRKVQTLTTTEETAIKEIIKNQISDYFHFIFHCSELVNISRQEELELAIKMTFYRSKVLNFDLENTSNDILNRLRISYASNSPTQDEKVLETYNYLKDFMISLQYGSKSFQKEVKTYRDIYEMNQ